MSSVAAGAGDAEQERLRQSAAAGRNPWLIAGVVSIATFMEVLDVTITTVSLRHIAGSLAVSYDEATWVQTSYLVSNAVILPLSGWLSTVIGRKRFYMLAVCIFTVSSLLCGLAWSLDSLIYFRVLQGLGGGGLAPSEQSILADTFPPEKRGQAFGLYGLAVVLAPAIGPTLGGIITDNASWHWIFFINLPMGVLSLFLVGTLVGEPSNTEEERRKLFKGGLKIDFVRFLLVALGLGCLEVVLDEGQRDDWFVSNFITTFAVVSALSLIALIPWELSRKNPIVDLRLLGRRQFGTCFFIMLIVGGVLVSTTQIIPQLLQTQFGYTATLAGNALSAGGLVLLVMMPIAGFLTGKVQARWLITMGLTVVGLSMWHLTSLTSDIDFNWVMTARIFTTIGLPFLFLPITTASYQGLPAAKTNQASGLINVARNLGGSIFVAMTQTLLQQREQFHHARLVGNLTPTNPAYVDTLNNVTSYFTAKGSSAVQASQQAVAWIGQTVDQQASLFSYIDAFAVLGIICAIAVPFAFLLKPLEDGAVQKG